MRDSILAALQHFRRDTPHNGAIYTAVTLLAFHSFVLLYINSSFLEQFLDRTAVSTLYTLGAALTILVLLFVSPILKRVSNYRLMLTLIFVEFAVVLGMAFSDSLRTAVPLFILHVILIPVLYFNLDVYMEKIADSAGSKTGSQRGLFLGIMALAGGIGPFIAGQLVGSWGGSFTPVYLFSACLLVPLIYVTINYLRIFEQIGYTIPQTPTTPRSFWNSKDMRNVFFAHLFMRIFFTWMVIYTPLYLAEHAGFGWHEIGLIIFVAMMAYVLFEYPIGIIADRYIGEKEMMGIGFLVILIATVSMAYIPAGNLIAWIVLMFISRVGASLVEVTTEGYFFKKAHGAGTGAIGFFRILRPFSYVVGALIGSVVLLYVPFSMIFIVLGMLMLPGIYFASQLRDTK